MDGALTYGCSIPTQGDRIMFICARVATALSFFLISIHVGAQETHANRLISSGSPYLLQHAHNPVDWYPWGEEAISKAKTENKPIFISIGYSTCYWCHVAERTIYSDPAIAALMNKWFVNIKVDREERPDIDETYMLARQLLTGEGGWPNNVFLTPDLKPFFAGSYFPPKDENGATGFPTVLASIHEEWEKNPTKVGDIANEVHTALARLRDSGGKPARVVRLVPGTWLTNAREQILPRRDPAWGGFGGGGTKFPQSPLLGLLLADYRLNGTTASLHAVAEALDAMALGGIHDQLGGGMHRYSTEPTWSVPHFEKMLYDNAQLLGLYSNLYVITRQPLSREAATDIAGYLTRRMTAPEGGFYTAEDADIDGKEGATYLWTRAEIRDALGTADADRFFTLYELTPLPTEPAGPGVLRIRRELMSSDKNRASVLRALVDFAPLRQRLFDVREQRRQPARDDKIVVGLNGLAIAGLAHAGAAFGEARWTASAKRAAEFLWQHAYDGQSGQLHHHLYNGEARGDGFLDDYALLGLGFVALGEATGEAVWTSRAATLAAAIVTRFVKPEGVVVTSASEPILSLPAVDFRDYDMPSGTSATYTLLARLGWTEPRFADAAAKIMAWMAPNLEASPDSWASFTASAAGYGAAVAAPTLSELDSGAHVKATAHHKSADGHDEIVITLTIDPGYHVNANPASTDYLTPTTVTVGAENAKITYPLVQPFKPKFSTDEISVYESPVLINVEVPGGSFATAQRAPINIEVQACTREVCLQPAMISAQLAPC
jgi:uncharacterized protein YyaL (SSP411 family)